MIIAKVYGGLAGQMFQYALGRHLALKNTTELWLDTSWYNQKNETGFVRNFGLHHFHTHYRSFDKHNVLWWKIKLNNKLGKLGPMLFKEIVEKDFSSFDSSVLQAPDYSVLNGYWNSHRYFQDIRHHLLQEFTPQEQPDDANRRCLHHIKSTNAVSIHFRRGDYALTSFHGILSKEYYQRGIQSITAAVSNPHLFIFSDEPEWVLANMNFDHPHTIVDFNRDQKNYWDIELMKNCKYNIIANSGFSWWGAWLNNHPDKKVIVPAKWVNEGTTKFENVPEGWMLH